MTTGKRAPSGSIFFSELFQNRQRLCHVDRLLDASTLARTSHPIFRDRCARFCAPATRVHRRDRERTYTIFFFPFRCAPVMASAGAALSHAATARQLRCYLHVGGTCIWAAAHNGFYDKPYATNGPRTHQHGARSLGNRFWNCSAPVRA